ncbi:MAG: PLP-dependent aminotransferase family protein, partial [Verrucomicrobia bacterium]|nr:PLP-dependent aminotransferase family protein [Verrucomicrobiota bacterium]
MLSFLPGMVAEPIYISLAKSLEYQIETKVFLPGDRLPSVRSLCANRRLSVETVLHSFRILENRGYIEARPRSGFYIKWRRQLPEPSLKRRKLQSSEINVSRLRFQAFSLGSSKEVVPLGLAVPGPEILPAAKLARLTSALARRSASESVVYADPAGHPRLRQQLARRAGEWGCLLTNDDFIVTAGAAEAISLSLRAICDRGSAVLVESPTYYGILEMIQNLGLRVVEIPADPKSGVAVEDIEKAIVSIPKISACLLVTNYSNPLGYAISESNKAEIVDLLSKHQIPLIEDDIYGDLCRPDVRRPTIAKSFDQKGLVLS